eukprot:CAMPEP_0184654836 /NCGR_PEP_ID=MMETSP0308-20130426/12490_1 /TAXON_ID=38269 /ORGANISM="Gloeochaete witrockiana, Strain SAG 46.84" /LENGTH=388 /DNA_ID=CAMNT_0027091009 /DNA_START=282 /DNA_END=1445 /DNA_ORIENTATION=-
MTKRQVDRVHSWENVVAISGFSSSKSLVLKDAVERFGRIIYIPPGIILKGTLEPVEFVLSKSGYLFFANNQEVSTATEFCGWASLPKNRVVGLIRGFQSFMKPCEWHVNASIPLSRHQEDFKMPHSMAYALPPIENVFATSHRSISFGQIHTARGIAVVIPFARFMLNDLLHKIEEWHLPEWAPCNQNKTDVPAIDLIFHYLVDLSLETELEEAIRSALRWDSSSPIRHCFRSVDFMSGHLSDDQSLYPREVSTRFLHLLESTKMRTYRYFFLMDVDAHVVRPFWLDTLRHICSTYAPFWMLGSMDRSPLGLEKPPWWLALNANAVYTTEASFRSYVRRVFREYKGGLRFDVALMLYMLDQNYKDFQNHFHMFRYHNFLIHYSPEIAW